MLSWFRQIDDAETVAEVLRVARDYLATWTPEELKRIPEGCRPGRVRDATDLEELHSSLVEEYRSNRVEGDDLLALQRLTSFLVRASVRLAELKAPPEGDDEPPTSPPRRQGAARDD